MDNPATISCNVIGRGRPGLAGHHAAQHVDAVIVEVGAEKGVEQENLSDEVGDIDNLDRQVQDHEVVA